MSIQAVSPEFGVHFSRILPPQAGGDAASSASARLLNNRQRAATPSKANTILTSFGRVYVADSIIVLPSQEMLVFGMGAVRSGVGDAESAKQRSRCGIRPDARHNGPLLGGAAKAVVRGWLENDGD
ncbi:hypothetical protein [Bradyrhizobium oropedii]|uniref:hypothetical protein n=1 Tax=Bradyrhizobium oropedii TaxID=1571201 RepID=UPI001E508CBB